MFISINPLYKIHINQLVSFLLKYIFVFNDMYEDKLKPWYWNYKLNIKQIMTAIPPTKLIFPYFIILLTINLSNNHFIMNFFVQTNRSVNDLHIARFVQSKQLLIDYINVLSNQRHDYQRWTVTTWIKI